MKILLFGASGQIGRAFSEIACGRGWGIRNPSHAEVNICANAAVVESLQRALPSVIVNAAAYTAVDQAETETEEAFRVNRDGAAILAKFAADADLPIIHLSTDYVFDGCSDRPYVEQDPVNPLGVYGKSKESGERMVRAAGGKHIILRTSWIYSPFGTNFVRTMLRLGSERTELLVVDDQVGCPTSAVDVASAIADSLTQITQPGFRAWGTYHYAGDAVTWYEFAEAIFERAAQLGLRTPTLRRVSSSEFCRPAPRPKYSVLSTDKFCYGWGIVIRGATEMRHYGAAILVSGMIFATPALGASIQSIQGEISINRGDGFRAVTAPIQTRAGDLVRASRGSRAKVVYEDGCVVEVKGGAVVRVGTKSPCKTPYVLKDDCVGGKSLCKADVLNEGFVNNLGPFALGTAAAFTAFCISACDDDGGRNRPASP